MKTQIILKNPSDLIPYVNNARTHSETQINQIAASIKEFGFNNPILTDGDNGIIAGHGRLQAALKLGLKEVPVIELSHLTDIQKKAYILADNRLAELAEWDNELLNIELEELKFSDFDIELTGFENNEIIDDEIIDINENFEINDSINFIIKCENLTQYEKIETIIGKSKKISYEEFIN